MILSVQPVNREVFITNNKDEMLKDIDLLSYDEYINKWSRDEQVRNSVHSRVFEKWIQSPTTNWKSSIKNAIILSTLGINNSKMAKMTDLHAGTIYNMKLGRLYAGEQVLVKLENTLGIELYRK